MSADAKNYDDIEATAETAAAEISPILRSKPKKIIRQLKAQLATLRESYKKIVYSGEMCSHAFEWLFDNYYILEREGRIVIKALSKLDNMPCGRGGVPIGFTLAEKFCVCAAGRIDAAAISAFIKGAQKAYELESAELSNFAVMLRASLIGGAARACSANRQDEERERLLSDAVKTLNFLTTFDFSEIVESQSRLEQILLEDPCGCYGKMDERSRAVYRRRLSDIARKRRMSESEAAKLAVSLARKGKTARETHVGYYIFENELDRPKSGFRGRLYLFLLFALPAVLAAVPALVFRRWWLFPVLYLPAWELIRPLTEHFIMRGVPATFLPRLELDGAVPEQASTLVVISTLLFSPQKIDGFVEKLEQFYYSNGLGNVRFGVLADLKEAGLPERPEDKAVRQAACKAVRKLNRRYGNRFFLFIRSRRLSASLGQFSGWERKRGAIVELVRCIKGRQTSITTIEGDKAALSSVKYLITLDADTGLLMDSALEMVSVAMHPLNAPELDEEKSAVVRGYGILTPRMGVELGSAGVTPFSRIMAGRGGVTAYDNAVGDIYQDLFSEGIYSGKGLINVDAFYAVLDRALPENRILSHDILEGCFMRAAFLSDVELTDGFPARPGPWFSRLHRWNRGDWQNISYIGRRIRTADGIKPSPFNALSRFKLFDNLRRSVTPAAAFGCLIAAAFTPLGLSLTLIGAALLSLVSWGILNAVLAVVNGGPSMLSRKYHSRVMPQAVNALAQGVLSYLFLPYTAFSALDAVCRALTRQVTGKKMLEWTTAAETESKPNSFSACMRRFWPAAFFGIVFLALAPQPAAKIAAAAWVVTPLLAWFSGRATQTRSDELDEEQKDKLRSYAAAMWRYYEDYAAEGDHFLPPDNVQEAPIHVVAHRTSPTNIGLCLLSTLAARDMGLIDSETLFERVANILGTIKRLDKWQGHLYNWYDTRSLRPLTPRYVSTVDSGNFLCCLTALLEGLTEYAAQGAAAWRETLDDIRAILDSADIAVLFNKRRKLFHIGYDAESGEKSAIYYDLLMSESRMTSFYAIAERAVPKRHWGALGRTLAKQNGYTGPVSWTGTMFEYMMPHLLLPVYEDSMSAEALRFAIYCQKQRVREAKTPWGISESGFYAFDAALNYQYKAHGVQKLALKRGMDGELVVSPYSTFLALPFDPGPAFKNLERLEELGMVGRCGFYEAADFTYRRTGGDIAVIKSYMAHHVGMSIVAAANALFEGVMQERFMRDNRMRAARELLQEKIPSNAVVFNDVLHREIPEKPGRAQLAREQFEDCTPVSPRVHIISNGEYTMVLTDVGASLSLFRGIDIFRRSGDLLRAPLGLFAVASLNGKAAGLTAAPAYSGKARRRVEFNADGAVFSVKYGYLEASMTCAVHRKLPCEIRSVEITNQSPRRAQGSVLFYFEPTLSKTAEEAAHPAFSRLFLNAAYRSDTKTLVFARRPRGGEHPAYLAVGLAEQDADFEFETDRARVLSRPEGIASLPDAAAKPFSGRTGALPDAACAIRVKTALPARGKKTFTLLLAAANSADEAEQRVIEARRQGARGAALSPAGSDADEMETRLAALILPQALFPVGDARNIRTLAAKNKLGQEGLWRLGVSGDYPIVLLSYSEETDGERLRAYIKTHRSLRLKGIQLDLVIAFREGGDYARAKYGRIMDAVRDCGCEYLLESKAGIHPVDLGRVEPEVAILLDTTACHSASAPLLKRASAHGFELAAFQPAPPAPDESDAGFAVWGGKFVERGFRIPQGEQKPFAPWCQILANPTFGTIVSDRALGCSWAVNARENKLTPWTNDPQADLRGEMLILRAGGRFFDLIAGASVFFAPGLARYDSVPAGLCCRVTVRVPKNACLKEIVLEIENGGDTDMEIEAAYYAEPVLSCDKKAARLVSVEREKDAVIMRCPWAPVRGAAFMAADAEFSVQSGRAAFFSGRWDAAADPRSPDPCAAIIVKRELPAKRSEKIRFVLGWAADEKAVPALCRADKAKISRETPLCSNDIHISTPDKALDAMVNGWLRWQFMASRIWGRNGFYQCGGAWGFRDQLQDGCAAALLDPETTRVHLLRACARQFEEGDVLHWWHQLPPRDGGVRGVRTRCSDDMLWLPYAVCDYIEKTGDDGILNTEIAYLGGPELDPSENDRYFSPPLSELKESVYRHCTRAIERADRRGAHGIPLFGAGDWNDGMNLVGAAGRGESVWLAMFLILVLEKFAVLCNGMGDSARAEDYRRRASELRRAVDENCWDGEWYLRGFYDDGAPLGGRDCDECRIDLLPQSFAVFAGMPDEKRRNTALDSALGRLCDERLSIVRLFAPAFDAGGRNPGYIKAYPPGIRENGGQYTHGAVWLALSLFEQGRADDGYRILSMLNPAARCQTREQAEIYRLEPYVLAGDIYANPSCEGRGGWSFYTGSAAWFYRTAVETLLGIRPRGDHIEMAPCLPSSWDGFSAKITLKNTVIDLSVTVTDEGGGLLVDGARAGSVPLDEKPHKAEFSVKRSRAVEKPAKPAKKE